MHPSGPNFMPPVETPGKVSTTAGNVHPTQPATAHTFSSAHGNDGVELNYGGGALVHVHPGDPGRKLPPVAHQVPPQRTGLGGDQRPLSPRSQAAVFERPDVHQALAEIEAKRNYQEASAKQNHKPTFAGKTLQEVEEKRTEMVQQAKANMAAAAASGEKPKAWRRGGQ